MHKSIVISFICIVSLLVSESYSQASNTPESAVLEDEELATVKQAEKDNEKLKHPAKILVSPEDKLDSNPRSSDQNRNFKSPLGIEATVNKGGDREACQVTVSVSDDLRCSLESGVESQMTRLHHLMASMQAQMNYQRKRLDSTHSFIRRIRYTVNQRQSDREDLAAPLGSRIATGERSDDFSTRSYRSEASETLRSMSEEMQVMLANLEIQIDEADNRRDTLRVRNSNLTREVDRKSDVIRNMTLENKTLKRNSLSLMERLSEKESEITLLQTTIDQLKREKNRLETTNHELQESVAAQDAEVEKISKEVTTLGVEIERLRTERQQFEQNLSNASKQMIEMNSIITSFQESNNSKSGCNYAGGISTIEDVEKDIPSYTHCGLLINVSEPQTVRQSRKLILHRVGVWMKDPLAPKHSNKIWAINQSGVRVRRVYQYANMSAFQKHHPETIHTLPVSMESNGAVVYNGSLFYQRRNSRRIVKYVFSNRNHVTDRSIKHAGFHGMFAYQWGGFTDIDFAVDETGLWVIYSTPRGRGNIIVSEINPKTLQIIRTIRTPIPKRKVANAFIICQVLYTVSGFRSPVASINYSFDLNTKKGRKSNIPFSSDYQFNTMIDYNPRDRFIYSWDNGRQVLYKATLDASLGQVRSRDSSELKSDRSSQVQKTV